MGEARVSGDDAKADAIFAAREAALVDPDGRNLEKALGKHGVAPQPVREVPIRFVKSAGRKGRESRCQCAPDISMPERMNDRSNVRCRPGAVTRSEAAAPLGIGNKKPAEAGFRKCC